MARRPALTADELSVMRTCVRVIDGNHWDLEHLASLPLVIAGLTDAHLRLRKLGWLRTLAHSGDSAWSRVKRDRVPWRLALSAAGGEARARLVEQGKI